MTTDIQNIINATGNQKGVRIIHHGHDNTPKNFNNTKSAPKHPYRGIHDFPSCSARIKIPPIFNLTDIWARDRLKIMLI